MRTIVIFISCFLFLSSSAQLVPKDTTVTHDSSVLIPTKTWQPVTHDTTYFGKRDSTWITPKTTFICRLLGTCKEGYWSYNNSGKKDSTTTHDSSFMALLPFRQSYTHDSIVWRQGTATSTGIIWGARLQGTPDEQRVAAKTLGVKAVRIANVEASTYTGYEKQIEEWYEQGFTIVVNFVWKTQNPAPFPKGADLTKFLNVLDQFLAKYGKMIKRVVIENEPTVRAFYDYNNYTIKDYIAQLSASIPIAEKYKVEITDGGTHIDLVQVLMNGGRITPGTNVSDVNEILNFEATVKSTYFYWNIHHAFKDGKYTKGQIAKVCAFMNTRTGHRGGSNEWHIEHCPAGFMTIAVNEWKQADIDICFVWDQKSSKNENGNITNGSGVINANGTDFAQAIKN